MGDNKLFREAMNLGSSHAWSGRWAEAAAEYRLALEQSPGDNSARTYLAMALFRAGTLSQALGLYQDLWKAQPANVTLLGRVAEIQEAIGDRESAAVSFRLLAEIHSRKRSLRDAFQAWRKVVELKPFSPAFWNSLIDLASQLNEVAEVLPGYLELARQLAVAGRFEEALQVAERASVLDPASAEVPALAAALRRALEFSWRSASLGEEAHPEDLARLLPPMGSARGRASAAPPAPPVEPEAAPEPPVGPAPPPQAPRATWMLEPEVPEVAAAPPAEPLASETVEPASQGVEAELEQPVLRVGGGPVEVAAEAEPEAPALESAAGAVSGEAEQPDWAEPALEPVAEVVPTEPKQVVPTEREAPAGVEMAGDAAPEVSAGPAEYGLERPEAEGPPVGAEAGLPVVASDEPALGIGAEAVAVAPATSPTEAAGDEEPPETPEAETLLPADAGAVADEGRPETLEAEAAPPAEPETAADEEVLEAPEPETEAVLPAAEEAPAEEPPPPITWEDLLRQARETRESERLRDLFVLFEESVAAGTAIARQFVELAETCELLGQGQQAAAAYEQALGLARDHPRALLGRARFHLAEGEQEAAEERLRRALEHVGPGDEGIVTEAAGLLLDLLEEKAADDLGATIEALAWLQVSAFGRPLPDQVAGRLAATAVDWLGQCAGEHLEEVALLPETDRHVVVLALREAEQQLRQGRARSAADDMYHLIVGRPDFLPAQSLLARSLVAQGKRAEARDHATRLLGLYDLRGAPSHSLEVLWWMAAQGIAHDAQRDRLVHLLLERGRAGDARMVELGWREARLEEAAAELDPWAGLPMEGVEGAPAPGVRVLALPAAPVTAPAGVAGGPVADESRLDEKQEVAASGSAPPGEGEAEEPAAWATVQPDAREPAGEGEILEMGPPAEPAWPVEVAPGPRQAEAAAAAPGAAPPAVGPGGQEVGAGALAEARDPVDEAPPPAEPPEEEPVAAVESAEAAPGQPEEAAEPEPWGLDTDEVRAVGEAGAGLSDGVGVVEPWRDLIRRASTGFARGDGQEAAGILLGVLEAGPTSDEVTRAALLRVLQVVGVGESQAELSAILARLGLPEDLAR